MRSKQLAYQSYLLRLWQVKENDKTGWRASLERVETGARRAFPSLEALFAFLLAETEDEPDKTTSN